MNTSLSTFQIIFLAMSPKVPENFKEKHSQLPSKIDILSKEIWQLSNVHTAFLLLGRQYAHRRFVVSSRTTLTGKVRRGRNRSFPPKVVCDVKWIGHIRQRGREPVEYIRAPNLCERTFSVRFQFRTTLAN